MRHRSFVHNFELFLNFPNTESDIGYKAVNTYIFLRKERVASQAQVYAITASNLLYVTIENSETPGVRLLIPGITLAKWLQTWKLFLDNKWRWNSSKVCIRPCTGMDLGTYLWSRYGIIVSLPLSDKILKLCHHTKKSAPSFTVNISLLISL